MSKHFVTYAGTLLLLTCLSSPVRADIEAIQGAVMGPIQTVLQEAKAIQEDLNEIKEELRSAAEGVSGPIKDAAKAVNDAKAQVQSGVEMANSIKADPMAAMGNKMPGFLGDLDIADQEMLQSAIKGNYLMQIPKASEIISNSKSSALSVISGAKEMAQSATSEVRSAAGNVTSAATAVQSTANATVSKAGSQQSIIASPQTTQTNVSSQAFEPVAAQNMLQTAPEVASIKAIQPARQAFTTQVLSATSGIAASQAKIQAGMNNISDVQNSLNALKADIAQNEPVTTSVAAQLQSGSDSAGPVQSKLGDLKASIAQSQEAVAAANAKVQTGVNSVSEIKSKLGTLKADIAQNQPAAANSLASTEAKKAAKINAKEISQGVSAVKKSSERLKSGFRQPAVIKNEIRALDKGAWLLPDETVKTASYSHSETLMFGAESGSSETDLVKISREQEEKMSALQRENFANLYALAFTIRTNIAKENAEAADAKSKENSRDIIQATKDQALEMTKRLRKFLIMEAAVYEFKASQQSRQYSFAPEEEDDDE